ncbi:MAG: DUF3416 domain-containing protein, partial [Fibrobacter sp.]|nr:DUF3416 domain-containing protein [Fibrobacter sp.]
QDFVRRVNTARQEHAALQEYDNLEFHYAQNDQLMVYSKKTGDDIILCVCNMDMDNPQEGLVEINMSKLGMAEDAFYFLKDVITGDSFVWRGSKNFVRLDPARAPGHMFIVKRI